MSKETDKQTQNETASGATPCSVAILAMCQAYAEMNTIRARDGVPYCFDGRKSDVSQDYWDSIMDKLNTVVTEATGQGCWLNPCLYQK